MPRVDPEKFNSDPKHEQDRQDFDKMVEGAFNRIAEKKKKENPSKNPTFLDELLEGIFGDK